MKNTLKRLANAPLSLVGLELRKIKGAAPPIAIPVEASEFERELILTCGKYSMTGSVRMWALIQSLQHVITNKVEGSFVECGVWKGGNLALMRKYLDYCQVDANVVGYDTFDGMSAPTDYDVDFVGNKASDKMWSYPKSELLHNIHAFAGIEQVRDNLRSLGVDAGVDLIQGKVEDTLLVRENLPDKIAVLRLDTDWYESTRVELEILYPRLCGGGVLILDDYGHYQGAKKAVDEYFSGQLPWLHYVDYTCRLMIKPH